jgi:site-specific DNA recombinase
MRKITKIEQTSTGKTKPKKLRVAAYCRVSTDSDEQLESLETQKTHYEGYITSRDDWQFAGIYYDEGISGTGKARRPELERLMQDCRAGKIDMVITKSISRFSRNTTDCLELVRKLLELNIPIWFEKENINTGSMESELFLSILSSMAADESLSISLNSKWSIKKRFENGTFKISYPPYGYDWGGQTMTINPEQAEIVRRIFADALSGKGTATIASELNREQIQTKRGGRWSPSCIRGMLANEKYCGDCLYQKTWSDSAYKRHLNHGEQEQYLQRNHHEPIISREDWEAVQKLISQRADEKNIIKGDEKYQNRYGFSGRIICGECGATFKRRINYTIGGSYAAWSCKTHLADKDKCSMLFIRDSDLKLAFTTMMNKLIFAHRLILKPYAESLKRNSTSQTLSRIQQLETSLAENADKRKTLTKLMAQGFIDQVIYSQQTTELLSQADAIRKKIDALKNTTSNETTVLMQAEELLHFTEKSPMMETFDEELFTQFVERVVIRSRHKAAFELKCGLTLAERM